MPVSTWIAAPVVPPALRKAAHSSISGHEPSTGRMIGAGIGVGAADETVEDVDDRIGQDCAQPPSFVGQGDEEGGAAGRGQRAAGLFQPDAVAVALDHGGGGMAAAGDVVGERLPVGAERDEIDGQAAAGGKRFRG